MAKEKIVEIKTIKQVLGQNVQQFADKVAYKIREGEGYRQLTYKQVGEKVAQLQSFMAKLGIVPGDRIALISENRPEWPITYLAVTAMGAVAVPLDAMLRKEEILPLIEDSEPKLMFCTQKYTEYVKGTAWENKAVLMEEFDKLPAAGEKVNNEVKPESLAAIVYTSGTTGAPKGVMLTHYNIISDVLNTLQVVKVYPNDIWLSVLPLHHTFETTCGFFGAFVPGTTVIYAESLKSHAILANMQDNGITIMCGVPLLYQLFYEGILREVEEKKMMPVFRVLFGLSAFFKFFGLHIGRTLFGMVHKKFGGKIRMFVAGGAAMDLKVLKNFELMGFNLIQGYGMTEAAPIITCNYIGMNRLGSVGKVIPGVTVKINEKNGEILTKGSNVMQGYYKRQSLTDEVIIDGWLHTGDVGYMDKDGFVFITGRCKDVIVTASGVNVYPEEIEHWLKQIPAIKEVCVMGSRVKEGFRKGSEEVAAVIVPNEGKTEEEIKAAIAEVNKKLAEYKRVARTIFRKEELPKTRLLKIKRFVVRKEMGL